MADDKEPDLDDPAEYLFKQVEFHNCSLTVGDPSKQEVEKIAVVKSQLVAHSSVFRHMLMDSDLADPTGSNTHIKDVRPATFKLMLKHMYGGSLQELKTMHKENVLELALCADKYNVRRLLEKACKKLIPRDVNEVFIPLRFVGYVPNPVLVPHVVKFVQEETDKIVEHKEFLKVDENCMEFIAKQDKLAIDEIDLWRALVKWGENQAQQCNLSLQDLLKKPLAYVRFATFNADQFTKEVMSKGILSTDEFVKILTSIANSQPIDIPGFCNNHKRREIFSKRSLPIVWDVENCQDKYEWTPSTQYGREIKPNKNKLCDKSVLFIQNELKCNVALISLVVQANAFDYISQATYWYSCEVTIVKSVNGCSENCFYVKAEGTIVCDEIVSIPLKSSSGNYCILEPSVYYKVFLKFSSSHPTHRMEDRRYGMVDRNFGSSDSRIRVKYDGEYFHVKSVWYKVQSFM